MSSNKKLYLTGASGLLGRAIYTKFCSEGWDVYGTSFSRSSKDLKMVDLTSDEQIISSLNDYKPDFVIHSAAFRFPEQVDSHPLAAINFNVNTTKKIAEIADSLQAPLLYISTDYVFDGENAPYDPDDEPKPVNHYGRTKLAGEQAVLQVQSKNIVLRIPVLYGPVETLEESAVTVLLKNLINSETPTKISDYEIRRPSHVDDIAQICYQIAESKLQSEVGEADICGIMQWCGAEPLTKYEMTKIMARALNLSSSHIIPIKEKPVDGVKRPYDTTMSTEGLTQLGFGQHTPFEQGIRNCLKKWV